MRTLVNRHIVANGDLFPGPSGVSAHFSAHHRLPLATTEEEDKASQLCIIFSLERRRRSEGGRLSVFNESIKHPAAKALVGMAPEL